MGASLGQKDIKGVEQTKAQCLVIFLVLEGALGAVDGKERPRTPPIAQSWDLSTLMASLPQKRIPVEFSLFRGLKNRGK